MNALEKHLDWAGKLDINPKMNLSSREELAAAYTPGVAEPCLAIAKEPELSYKLTGRGNLVAVITDGSAVLGLGDIGPLAAMPVMEGKCALFKAFGGVDAIPLCISTKDPDEFVRAVELLGTNFGGINLEDISAPRCFAIERELKRRLDIPVFHDDRHGTAIVILAALTNALKVVGKKIGDVRIAVSGAGAAGDEAVRTLIKAGAGEIAVSDKFGEVFPGRRENDEALEELSKLTVRGGIAGADVFIGVSAPGIVTPDMVRSMSRDPIVFAMANPVPEIMPGLALQAGAAVAGTGRSDFPNQINNVLAFPGVFRGALDARVRDITDEMKLAAAYALAGIVETPSPDYVIPGVFDKRVCPAIARSITELAARP